MTRHAIAALALLLLSTGAEATPVCRWADESGRIHIAEVVPEKYTRIADCKDSKSYELSPEQRQPSTRRTPEVEAGPGRAPVGSHGRPDARAAARPTVKRPAEAVTDATDCPTRWRLYDESAACFAPYRTTRGAIKAKAFDKCKVVESPEPKCGPRRN
ncbi:hypothetical protein BH11PSE8_BH11PSE8_28170 [soil metagenome]